jgi:hypothetical protein
MEKLLPGRRHGRAQIALQLVMFFTHSGEPPGEINHH